MSKKGNIRSHRRSLRIWGGYLLVLVAWVVAVMALAFLGVVICSSITWQPSLIYDLLQWVKEYIVLVCILTVLIGWVVISFYFISKPIKQLDVVATAAEQLSRPSEEPIQLPDSLEDISIQLNLAREQALRDARAAREAEQRKNDLIVYLAHDLKTPLTSVIGYLTLLRDEPQISPEIRARYTGIALEKAERLEDLINEFFDITRFNLSHLELERQSVDLTRMLEQVASEFRPIFAESGLTCSLDLPPKLPYSCDPDKLARVFDNLLRNASYYSLPDSTVEIAGKQVHGEIVLTFSNAGKNIPQEKLDRIFDQFFRLDSSRATRTGGAGLGLAIAKEIVELHGGTIRADSTGDRITFTIVSRQTIQKRRKKITRISQKTCKASVGRSASMKRLVLVPFPYQNQAFYFDQEVLSHENHSRSLRRMLHGVRSFSPFRLCGAVPHGPCPLYPSGCGHYPGGTVALLYRGPLPAGGRYLAAGGRLHPLHPTGGPECPCFAAVGRLRPPSLL